VSPATSIAEQRQVRRPETSQPARRPPLAVVERRRRVRRRRVVPFVAGALVACSLLLVVAGHSELAQGQVRLSSEQAQLTAAQTVHREDLLSVANLEDPSRIVSDAENTLHMVAPAQVTQLPHVSLGSPVPAPTVTTTTTSAPTASTATTGQ
jgi:hypothetical protein